jgi:hypothetical protein
MQRRDASAFRKVVIEIGNIEVLGDKSDELIAKLSPLVGRDVDELARISNVSVSEALECHS